MSNFDHQPHGLNSLTTIIKRLEAATSRLEDIALSSTSAKTVQRGLNSGPSTSAPQISKSAPAPTAEEPKSVKAYEEMVIQAKLQPFVKFSEGLGGPVIEQARVVSTLFEELGSLIYRASASTKPSDANIGTLVQPMVQSIDAIGKIKDSNRGGKNRDFFSHLSAVAEGVPAMGWVQSPKPAPVVAEAKDAAQFYADRVIRDYKEKDPKHVDWMRSFLGLLEELRKYILEYHTTGLVWNTRGGDALAWSKPGGSTGASAGGPPPPPPPPPPPVFPPADAPATAPVAPGGGAAAVFADLNKGEAITAGLRKVPKDQMTHKNPALRNTVPVPSSPTGSSGKKPLKPTKPTSLAGKKPSRLELEGVKWIVEYFEGEKSLVIDKTEKNHVINLYGLKNCTVQVKGKVNAVSMNNCNKTSILIESVISSVSVANSQSFALQITGTAPTVQVDASDSGQIYLSKDCLGAEIMTAKCSAINVSLPVEGEEEGIFVEKALPEMLRTTIQGGKLVTTFVEHSG